MAAVASPVAQGLPRPRVRDVLRERAQAMSAHVEEELRVSASRLNIPMILVLFALGQLGGCASVCITGTWWVSRLSFRVEQLEIESRKQGDQIELQRLLVQSMRENLASRGWNAPQSIDVRPSRKEGE